MTVGSLASQIKGDTPISNIRLGVITAINPATTPATLEVDGRVMCFFGDPMLFSIGDTVVWLMNGPAPIVLGMLYNGVSRRIGGRVRRNALLGIATNTLTQVPFDVETSDPQNFITVTAGVFTVPANCGGQYLLRAHANCAVAVAGRTMVEIVSNQANENDRASITPGEFAGTCVALLELPAAATFSVNILHNNGVNTNWTVDFTWDRLHR